MRTKFVVLMVLAFVVMLAVPASAGNFVSKGIGVVFGAGSEKDQWSSSLIFTGTMSGPLFPVNGELVIQPGETVFAQMNFTGAHGPKAYDFLWEIGALTAKKNKFWNQSELDQDLGWLAEITPADYSAATETGLPVPLQLRVIKKDGKDKFIRVIFKITYSEENVREHDLLYIRVAEPAPPAPTQPVEPSAPCEETEEAINQTREALEAVSEQLATHSAVDAETHRDLVADSQRQDANIASVRDTADEAKAEAKANAERLDVVEDYLSGLSGGERKVGDKLTYPQTNKTASTAFTTQWVNSDGNDFLGTVYLRCRRETDRQVVTGHVRDGFARWPTVADGGKFSFEWRVSQQCGWLRHTSTAYSGMTETISVGQ